jgi:ElaB/YqjD/DUF883 family membrane-anchored ribosome-binding protein
MPANDTRSPDEIEQDIRATQRDMSNTVNQIEQQLTPRNLLNSLLDKADESGVDARTVLNTARRNPLALGMIAIGGLWLVSDSDARPSSLKPNFRGSSGGDSRSLADNDPDDDFHRGYVTHMSSVEHQANEDWEAWRRRRDHARASYLMIEPRHDENEHSFRSRLDEATESMRQRREQASDRARIFARQTYEGAGNLAHGASDRTRRAASQARNFYDENPLLGGLAAAFVGAIVGNAIPVSRTEEEQLGRLGSQAIDRAKDTARHAGERAREKKDELVEAADRHVHESGDPDQGSSGSTTRAQEFGPI